MWSMRTRRQDAMNPKTSLIRQIPAFADLPPAKMAELSGALDVVHVRAGRNLLRQGARGHEFYVVIEGTARVERDGVTIARVGAGDVVGEQALVGAGQRNATVVAETPMVVLTSTRPYFAGLVADIPAFGRQVREATTTRAAV